MPLTPLLKTGLESLVVFLSVNPTPSQRLVEHKLDEIALLLLEADGVWPSLAAANEDHRLGGAVGVAVAVAIFTAHGNARSSAGFTAGFTAAIVAAAVFSLLGAAAGLSKPRRQPVSLAVAGASENYRH